MWLRELIENKRSEILYFLRAISDFGGKSYCCYNLYLKEVVFYGSDDEFDRNGCIKLIEYKKNPVENWSTPENIKLLIEKYFDYSELTVDMVIPLLTTKEIEDFNELFRVDIRDLTKLKKRWWIRIFESIDNTDDMADFISILPGFDTAVYLFKKHISRKNNLEYLIDGIDYDKFENMIEKRRVV